MSQNHSCPFPLITRYYIQFYFLGFIGSLDGPFLTSIQKGVPRHDFGVALQVTVSCLIPIWQRCCALQWCLLLQSTSQTAEG